MGSKFRKYLATSSLCRKFLTSVLTLESFVVNVAYIASASSAANLSESSLSLLKSKLESYPEPASPPPSLFFSSFATSFIKAFYRLTSLFCACFLSLYSLLTLSRISYSSMTCLYWPGSYPFHWSLLASQPSSTCTSTSSLPMSLPVYLAPILRGRSMHVLLLCVRAPQFVHAPLRNLLEVGSKL